MYFFYIKFDPIPEMVILSASITIPYTMLKDGRVSLSHFQRFRLYFNNRFARFERRKCCRGIGEGIRRGSCHFSRWKRGECRGTHRYCNNRLLNIHQLCNQEYVLYKIIRYDINSTINLLQYNKSHFIISYRTFYLPDHPFVG